MSTIEKTSPTSLSALELLHSRASAIKLGEPGPSQGDIEAILRAAVTAADHGRVRPWRFIVMQGEGRNKLGALMAQSFQAANPAASPEDLQREANKPLRAPVIIALVAKTDSKHKIPVIEQILAAGAAGAHLMLAANALGYGVTWKTGAAAYDPLVRDGLGFADGDVIIGFFYIGTDPKIGAPPPRAEIGAVTDYWTS
ncbi:MAG: nitroreductase [Caulobacterales bacterium]